MEETNDTQDVDLENNDSELETEENSEERSADTDARIKELEAEAAKWKRIASRKDKKAESEEAEESKPETKPIDDLDYGEKAYLRSAMNLKGAAELQLAKEWKKKYGVSVEEMETDEVFNARLTKLRETEAANSATPKGKGRSAPTAVTDIDLAYAKFKETGELPPDFETRNAIIDRISAEEKSPFTIK